MSCASRITARVLPAVAGVVLLLLGPARAADDPSAALGRALFPLVDPAPLASLATGADAGWRLQAATGLGERHQLRLTTTSFPSLSGPLPGFGMPTRFDSRATWRYTLMERPSWAWRVGLTTPMQERELRTLGSSSRLRFGQLPLLHVAGEGSIAGRWLLGVDADALKTARGRALEFALNVSYQLAPNFAVVGGYRMTEAGGEAEDTYGSTSSNSANVGLRLRF